MLPLYKDHTVVVTQRVAMSELRAGMTAAYMGESGRPVAHVLVKKTLGGWVAKGVGNVRVRLRARDAGQPDGRRRQGV